MALFSDSLFLPALALAALAFFVPRLLARVLPEGVKPLLLNAFLSTMLIFLLAGGMFVCLYLWQGATAAQLFAPGVAATVVFFGRLGLASAMIWAPILLLSVAGLPRKWVKKTW
ncbi:hypothetical protein ACJ5NV_01355 [Loktanella agnita]|uniref:hypothetical protein n=1 Tax=Loktanella agnita TaxID=287097 RepID=UPI00398850F8